MEASGGLRGAAFASLIPDPDDPTDFVLSVNLHRRQLTASQRAMVAGRAYEQYALEAKDRKTGRPKKSASIDADLLPPRQTGDRGRASRQPGAAVNVSSITAGECIENTIRKDFTISERVAIAAVVADEIGNRQGQRTDREAERELVENLPQVEAGKKTRQILADCAGFGNETTYRQAATVVEKGVPELITAMDREYLAISGAAKVAELPKRQQKKIATAEKPKEPAKLPLHQRPQAGLQPILAFQGPKTTQNPFPSKQAVLTPEVAFIAGGIKATRTDLRLQNFVTVRWARPQFPDRGTSNGPTMGPLVTGAGPSFPASRTILDLNP